LWGNEKTPLARYAIPIPTIEGPPYPHTRGARAYPTLEGYHMPNNSKYHAKRKIKNPKIFLIFFSCVDDNLMYNQGKEREKENEKRENANRSRNYRPSI
jgi:hypothetical protein